MKTFIGTRRLQQCLALLTCLFLLSSTSFAIDDLKPEQIIQRHQDAIGSPQLRAALSSRVVEGTALYKILVGGSGSLQGKGVFVSQGEKLHLLFKVNTVEYRGEMFVSNGSKTFVAGSYSDKSSSELGDFMRTQDGLLREGLICSTLSTAWPFLNGDKWKSKVNYLGIKKVDDREYYAFRYKVKGDLDTTLYFDPETFHHVLTIAHVTFGVGIGVSGELSSTSQQQNRYRIEQRFSHFTTSDGLKIPTHYEFRFTLETAEGFTKSLQWDVNVTNVANNIALDPRNFDLK